jgi:outer membrane protein TolC
MKTMKKSSFKENQRLIKCTAFIAILTIVSLMPVNTDAQQVYTQIQCREMALKHNQKLESSKEQMGLATDLRKSAFTQFLPSFDFTGTYTRVNKQFQILSEDKFLPIYKFDPATMSLKPDLYTMGGQPVMMEDGNPLFNNYAYLPKDQLKMGSKNIYLLNMGLIQPLFLGGKLQSMYRISKINEEVSTLSHKLETSDVIYRLDEAFWRVITVQEKVKVALEYKKLLDKLVSDLENLKVEGIITNNEVLKAKVKQSEADLMLYKAQNGLKLSKMALCQQVGIPIDADINVDVDLESKATFVLDTNFRNLALSNRPEIEMLKNAVKLTNETANIARSRFLPDIVLTANYTMANPNPYAGFVNEFGGDWNIGLVARVPIFHWGDRIHTMNAAKHGQKISEIKLSEAQEMISLQVQQAVNLYNESQRKIQLAQITLDQAKENLKQTNDNFEEGIVKTTDVLEAQLLWQKAYNELIDAKSEFRMQESNMQKVLGGKGLERL